MIDRLLAGFTFFIALTSMPAVALAAAPTTVPQPLVLEATIALPNTAGRIDHLAIDIARKRLFVTELGNGSADVVDLDSRKVIHRISGLDEPQSAGYVPKPDLIVIACGGDGTLRIFSGRDFSPLGVLKLGDDADNVRVNPGGDHVIVGYGSGGLAIVDPAKPAKLADIHLPAHPEAFEISPSSDRAYVNVPDAHQIDVADLSTSKLIAKWTQPPFSANFPLALDDGSHVAAAFRAPPRLALFDSSTGRMVTTANVCGDADDVFFDAKRQRYYVSCGAGEIDVFALSGAALRAPTRVATSWGARTSLFVPELDRLFVAVRAGLFGSEAAIRIYRPMP